MQSCKMKRSALLDEEAPMKLPPAPRQLQIALHTRNIPRLDGMVGATSLRLELSGSVDVYHVLMAGG